MTQITFVVKDAQGKQLLSRAKIANYTTLAREALSLPAREPLSVWRHDTVTGTHSYDAERTQRLTQAIVGLSKRAVETPRPPQNYVIQCTDIDSGKTGDFLKATEQPENRPQGHFKAASPIFPDLVSFFAWAKANNVTLEH